MKKIFMRSFALLLAVIILSLSGCTNESVPEKPAKEKFTKQYMEYFDRISVIVGYEENEEDFTEICEFVRSELERFNKLYDIYHAYEGVNNLYKINREAKNEPMTVDKDIISLLKFCKEVYTVTEGMTNVAMGSVLSIWHNYREDGIYDPTTAKLPPMEDLLSASEHCNIDDIVIDEDLSTVFLADSEMSIDVGAVGKGYATELIARKLEEMGVENYTLNIGGNIRTIGTKADGTDWVAGIQNPDKDSEETYLFKVQFSNLALVTSGSYQRYYYVDNVKYHHIINPDTLMPENTFVAVAILTPDSGLADALSTACFNMTLEEGREIVNNMENTEAVWVTPSGEIYYSEGFEKYKTEQ